MPTRKAHPQGFYPTWKRNHFPRPWNFFLKSPRVRKSKTFSQEGKCQFYQSFLVIWQDPCTSSALWIGAFWTCAWQDFNLNVPNRVVEQPTRSLEMKWSIIKRVVSKFVDVCGVVMSLNKRYISLSSWIVQPQITKRESSFVLCIVGFCSKTSLIGMICLNKLRKLNLFVRTNLDLFFQGSKIFNH
jgi:hypothetical protein